METPSNIPYSDSSTNHLYNLLFCDDIDLYKANMESPYPYPFDILFSPKSSREELQKIIADNNTDTRSKILACNAMLSNGQVPDDKNLFAVIVEVGLEGGLDVLASFDDGTARYINQGGNILIWETKDAKSDELTDILFDKSMEIVNKIGPWNQPRKPAPPKGNVRLSFLVSDGLYFGEGGINVLFNDQMASPALTAATNLMKYLTERSLEQK